MEKLRARFTSDPSVWSHVRVLLTHLLEIHHIPIREANLISLAADEAFTNIYRHAYGGETDGSIHLTVACDSERIHVEFKDFGKQCDSSAIKGRDLDDLRPGGLGVHIMKSVFDEVEYDISQEVGTVLRMRKRIDGGQEAEDC